MQPNWTAEESISSAPATKTKIFYSHIYFIGRHSSEQRCFGTIKWEAWLILPLCIFLCCILMFLLIWCFSVVQKWPDSQNQKKACSKITPIELKHSHWERKRKSWVIALRSHNFFDWLHKPINTKSIHNILLLLLYRDNHFLYQVSGLASSKRMNQGIRKQEFFFLPLEIREYYDISVKYCDTCFI